MLVCVTLCRGCHVWPFPTRHSQGRSILRFWVGVCSHWDYQRHQVRSEWDEGLHGFNLWFFLPFPFISPQLASRLEGAFAQRYVNFAQYHTWYLQAHASTAAKPAPEETNWPNRRGNSQRDSKCGLVGMIGALGSRQRQDGTIKEDIDSDASKKYVFPLNRMCACIAND